MKNSLSAELFILSEFVRGLSPDRLRSFPNICAFGTFTAADFAGSQPNIVNRVYRFLGDECGTASVLGWAAYTFPGFAESVRAKGGDFWFELKNYLSGGNKEIAAFAFGGSWAGGSLEAANRLAFVSHYKAAPTDFACDKAYKHKDFGDWLPAAGHTEPEIAGLNHFQILDLAQLAVEADIACNNARQEWAIGRLADDDLAEFINLQNGANISFIARADRLGLDDTNRADCYDYAHKDFIYT